MDQVNLAAKLATFELAGPPNTGDATTAASQRVV